MMENKELESWATQIKNCDACACEPDDKVCVHHWEELRQITHEMYNDTRDTIIAEGPAKHIARVTRVEAYERAIEIVDSFFPDAEHLSQGIAAVVWNAKAILANRIKEALEKEIYRGE